MMSKVLTTTQPICINGRSFLAFALSPEFPFENWLARFDDMAARSVGFFLQRPIVLDITKIEINQKQLKGLIGQLGKRKVRVMGVEGASPSLLTSDLPPAMSGGLQVSNIETPEINSNNTAEHSRREPVADDVKPSLLVTEPVRSGQSLISEGDITIVGSVASGAEVVANGSLHIYGTLRGRALAGATGETSSRIFCRKLEAELVAISGCYMTSEQLESGLIGHAAQFWLENDTLKAGALS